MMPKEIDQLITVSAAAARLALAPATLRRWIAQRRVAAVHLGRAVRIHQAEIDRLAREGLSDADSNDAQSEPARR